MAIIKLGWSKQPSRSRRTFNSIHASIALSESADNASATLLLLADETLPQLEEWVKTSPNAIDVAEQLQKIDNEIIDREGAIKTTEQLAIQNIRDLRVKQKSNTYIEVQKQCIELYKQAQKLCSDYLAGKRADG